jgi:hypothetical protein
MATLQRIRRSLPRSSHLMKIATRSPAFTPNCGGSGEVVPALWLGCVYYIVCERKYPTPTQHIVHVRTLPAWTSQRRAPSPSPAPLQTSGVPAFVCVCVRLFLCKQWRERESERKKEKDEDEREKENKKEEVCDCGVCV